MQATPERTEHATSTAPRTTPLSPDELFRFYEEGFLRLGRVVDDSTVDDLRRSIAAGRADARLESDLLDDAAWPDGEGGVPQEPGRTSGSSSTCGVKTTRSGVSSPTPCWPASPPRRSVRRASVSSRTTR